ncbi:phosphohydrolase [Oscillochloris sp. ZM17-4]|uniref:HD domain-containing protein n=1 Tax=Oscillochloris sp. ZM17-4 TaxID=2866714 RepID=UPI001C73BB31|nr:phosphohydrolase [Oscillochloris sp. ZM17-4]MBX0330347.1 phosphohydrolase [Oscillochloris sp. ZM17-4]
MSQPDYEQARTYALSCLTNDLDPALCYHSLTHTRDDVAPAMERLAPLEGVAGEALMLLRTAAYFHDLGFLQRREGHEEAGVMIAAAVLPTYGYSPAQIAQIGGMIMATRLPQSPRSLPEQLLADSDLDLLGRDDFLALNLRLRAELAHYQPDPGDAAWLRGQIGFLRGHRYWTASARRLREARKQQNIALLEQLLAQSES